jgi:hypothetical protein
MNSLVRRTAQVTRRQLLASLLRRGGHTPAPAPTMRAPIDTQPEWRVSRPLIATHGSLQTAILNHLFWKIQAAKTHHEDPSSVVADSFELAWSAYDCDFGRQPTESQLRSVRRAVLRLRHEGHVTRHSHGKYTLTDRAVEGLVRAKVSASPATPNVASSLACPYECASSSDARSERRYPQVGGFSTGLALSTVW